VTSQTAGDAMVAELKWVHRVIRHDLETVRRLADEVGDGLSGAEAAARIEDLAVGSPLWQLKINCLQYCRFVHAHHHAESALLFPRLRQSDPALGPVVDRLEATTPRCQTSWTRCPPLPSRWQAPRTRTCASC